VLALTADAADLSVVANCADTKSTEKRIYMNESNSSATARWCGSIYDNSTTTITVDIPYASLDPLKVPKTVNETTGNWGLKFVTPDSHTLQAAYGNIVST